MSKKELKPNDSIVARKTIKLNGRVYQSGDMIKDSTVDFRTREKLFRTGLVILQDAYEATYNKPATEVVEEVVVAVEETVVAETATEIAEEVIVEVPATEVVEEKQAFSVKVKSAKNKK